jgi:hypothetical protein
MAGPPLKKSSGQKSAGQKSGKLNHLVAKLGELQEQVKLIEAHSEQNERAMPKKTHPPELMIPKLAGSPGRSSPHRYNIQEAMGLGNDKRLYNTICVNPANVIICRN